jgi:hypothetical protein
VFFTSKKYVQIPFYSLKAVKEMADKMASGHRSQHEKSAGASKGEQQTNLETLHSKRTSKNKNIEEDITKMTCNTKKNDKQPTDKYIL